MASKDSVTTPVTPSVPLPSADLINFRFDQSDQNFKELKSETSQQFKALNDKLDSMNANFATKADLKDVQDDVESIKRNAKWWVGTIIAIAAVVVAFVSVIK